MARMIIFDMDPGIDDAMALMAACRMDVNILGVSVVAGNLPLETVAANASGILNLMGSDAQVYKGASGPLHGKLHDASDIHGRGGLGNWKVDADSVRISAVHAAKFIADTARAHPGQVTLVATGPLTNLAIALEYHRDDMNYLAGIICMGGALTVPGNVSPVAEYNIFADPDAAEAVFNSGLNPILIGLDVTRLVCLDERDVAMLSAGNDAARGVASMVSYYLERFPRLPLHDPLAFLAAMEPELFEFQDLAVRVEPRGELSRGQTIVDTDGAHGWPKNIKAALSVNAEQCRNILINAWTR